MSGNVEVVIRNVSPGPRIVHDYMFREVHLKPGEERSATISKSLADSLRARSDLVITDDIIVPLAAPSITKKPLVITGMFGIGDNLHQRGPIRELMKTRDVWLWTPHIELYHDLRAQGLKLLFRPTRLHAQALTIARERAKGLDYDTARAPPDTESINLWYYKSNIDEHGSILGAMYGQLGLAHIPENQRDFSMPVKSEWREAARELIAQWRKHSGNDKPLLIYRPLTARPEWRPGETRNPEHAAYAALFRTIQDQFFVVSLAHLAQGIEWIVGEDMPADIKRHEGEIDFPTMAGLFAEARMVFSPAGFAPVLAQAVGTPSIVVYGGRESYRTTDRAGAHLAPTLGIDPDKPCDCHNDGHRCDKRLTVEPHIERIRAFIAETIAAPRRAPMVVSELRHRILIFATTYIDSEPRALLMRQWTDLHTRLNPDCDFLIVDSASPMASALPAQCRVVSFSDNIGHLSRGGRDGWGRAFCRGLQEAIDGGYDYVVHVEGDSLFRLPIRTIIENMVRDKTDVASTPVVGTARVMAGWVETGLMFFRVGYLRDSKFIENYNWPARRVTPTPEIVIGRLLGDRCKMMPWKALRGDKNQITHQNIVSLNLDWVTHCHNDVWAYDKFFEANLPAICPDNRGTQAINGAQYPDNRITKLNFGCGDNRLDGWQNYDSEVDIAKPLPFADASADYILAEHVVEHIGQYEALGFFRECLRVLRPGGVVRIAVPSIARIRELANERYCHFTFAKGWAPTDDLRGALHAIIHCHGHKALWSQEVLAAALYACGFDDVAACSPSLSNHQALIGVDGHAKAISAEFNAIESAICEARKPGVAVRQEAQKTAHEGAQVPAQVLPMLPKPLLGSLEARRAGRRPGITPPQVEAPVRPANAAQEAVPRVALIAGGAANVLEELDAALALCREAGEDPTIIAVNDAIPLVPGPIVAATLHPPRVPGWLNDREKARNDPPSQVWSHFKATGNPCHVTHTTRDWNGSSGLFAVAAALLRGHRRIILCGVPMTPDGGHVVRGRNWSEALRYRKGWEEHWQEIKDAVRSMSGWTMERLGKPTVEFVKAL
jgi:SAM-dependent methyltransferase